MIRPPTRTRFCCFAADVERTFEVDCDRLIKCRIVEVGNFRELHYPSAVHDDIHSAKGFFGRVKHGLDRRRIGDIGLSHHHFTARSPDLVGDIPRWASATGIVHNDLEPVPRQAQCKLRTDTTRSACDYDDLLI